MLAMGLAGAHYLGWLPSTFSAQLPSADGMANQFAETRIGQVVLTGADGASCREMKFHNDTGQFSDSRIVRCNALPMSDETLAAPSGARVLSIRDGFSKR